MNPNDVACAAANAVLDTITSEKLLTTATARGNRLRGGLEQLVGTAPLAGSVRGRGLLLGLVLDRPLAAEVTAACRERHLVVNPVATDVVRFAPPLTVSRQEIDQALAVVTDALTAVAEEHPA